MRNSTTRGRSSITAQPSQPGPALTLVLLAAGLSTRFGSAKQLEPVGPAGEALLDYAILDAARAGFGDMVLVIRPDMEPEFRLHMERLLGGPARLKYATQELWDIPAGVDIPPGRKKPWGTGHAVMAAADLVQGPFAVANADDFYGAGAYAQLAAHLREAADAEPPVFALVGYRLDETLSQAGAVSRGICTVGEDGFVESAAEVTDIHRVEGRLVGTAAQDQTLRLDGTEIASMNLWGFTPSIFPSLQQQFARFLLEHSKDPETEFLIGSAVTAMVAEEQARLKVLPAQEQWFGLTHSDDKSAVTGQLQQLVEEDKYPPDLPAWFRAQRGE